MRVLPCGVAAFLGLAVLLPVVRGGEGELVKPDYEKEVPPASPTQVLVGGYLIDVVSINGAEQMFTADVVVRASWRDPRLANPGGGMREIPLSKIWNPLVSIANRRDLERALPEVGKVSPDGSVVYQQRLMGSFSSRFDLHDFPRDHQTLGIHFVARNPKSEDVEFVPDLSFTGRARELGLSGWSVENMEVREQVYAMPAIGDERSGVMISFGVKRLVGYYVATVFASAAIIVCMAWMVFWLPVDAINPRISISVTSMLTLIAHRFVVGGQLPQLSYLTLMDYFLLGSTFMVLLGLAGVVMIAKVLGGDNRARAVRINSIFRWAYPLAFLGILLMAI